MITAQETLASSICSTTSLVSGPSAATVGADGGAGMAAAAASLGRPPRVGAARALRPEMDRRRDHPLRRARRTTRDSLRPRSSARVAPPPAALEPRRPRVGWRAHLKREH